MLGFGTWGILGCGGGGGGGNGEVELVCVSEDGVGDGGSGISTVAFFLAAWIFSLYASFSSLMSRKPSLDRCISACTMMIAKAMDLRFCFPVQLLSILLEYPIRLMRGNEPDIMDSGISTL